MTRKAKIAIVTLDARSFREGRYLLRLLFRHWEAIGLEVKVEQSGSLFDEADLAILHMDTTRIPDARLAELRRYLRVINGRVTDISKRTFSANLLQRGDDYAGPVIVKTDANYGGLAERALGDAHTTWTLATGEVQRPWRRIQFLDPANYPIFDSIHAVPHGVWMNPRLVVEKFLPERKNDLYCLRSWYFLGDREIGGVRRSPQPIVKAANSVEREELHEVPDELRHWRTRLGFDYGKFDYGIVDGQVVLYDVNRTPTAGALITPEAAKNIADALSEGVYCYL